MQRITALEASLAASKAEINKEQQKLLATKPTTELLVAEFTDLQTSMLKLIEDETKKESVSSSTSDSSTTDATKKPKSAKRNKDRKDRKKKDETTTSATGTQPQDSQKKETSTVTTTAPTSTTTSTSQTQPESNNATEGKTDSTAPSTNANQTEENKDTKDPKVKKEWEVQKDIYMANYKPKFGPELEGKFIAVANGILYGPFGTLEEIKQAQGGEKIPGTFLARIGHEEDKPQRSNKNYRGRGGRGGARGGSYARRGDFNNRRGGGVQQQQQTQPNKNNQ